MTIALCMIVKNEAAVIRRCLDSAMPLCAGSVIYDTGSTDTTQTIIQGYKHRSGSFIEQVSAPWRNFSYNRNVALDACRERGYDFALVIDADDKLELAPDFKLPELTQDCYDITLWNGALRYSRPQLIRLSKPFHYLGVVHEFLECSEPFTRGHLEGIKMVVGQDGARRKDPNKYLEDAYLLRQALMGNEEPDLAPRYTFYLAQSLRDAGKIDTACGAYNKRTTMGGYREEVFYSHYQAGLLCERLKRPTEECLGHFVKAMEIQPERAEPYWAATKVCNWAKLYRAAWAFARAGIEIRMPKEGLFVETEVYRWMMLDEFVISAYHVGEFGQSEDACRDLLSSGRIPETAVERVTKNLEFAVNAALG